MVASFLTKALVPSLLLFFAAEQALAQSCNIKNNQVMSFYGLGSAGVYSKYKCDGNKYVPGSETLPPDQSGRSGGGESIPFLSSPLTLLALQLLSLSSPFPPRDTNNPH